MDSALFQFPNAAIMLVGDFNRIDYRFLCSHFNLRQTVQDPTRGNAILDLIFTNLSRYYNTPEILPGIGLSDHNSFIICPLTIAKKHKAKKVLRRSIKPSMKASFGRWLSTINWSFVETLPNCKEKLDAFNSLLLFGIDKFFPVRKYKQHPTDKPWITPDLKILIDQRQQAMSNDPPTFRRLRNKVNKINNTLRSSFFDKKVQKCDSSALWWKSINRLAGRPTNKTVSSMILSGKEIRGTQLATHINQSFLSITNSMDPLPELEDNETDTTDPNRMKYHISEQDVCKELSNLKRGKASGPDSILSWILKDFAPELSSPIARIFNASIQESSVPDPWKEADVIPVPKVNIIKEAEKDLRPISLTAILSKTLEHFVTEWIMKQINHLIDRRQFGALPDLSTTHALVSFFHHLYSLSDVPNQCVRILLLDFSKAFDRINHRLLITKMEGMDIDPILIAWVRNFLTGRKQRVKIGKFVSSLEPVNGGVPQGTVLGPILFIIMINDLLMEYQARWKYVEDSTVTETLTRDQPSSLQATLESINQWCEKNDMRLNTKKCKEVLICFWKHKPDVSPLILNNQPIEVVKSAKLLGLTFNDHLKWNDQVGQIVKKSSKRLYMLRLLKRARADTKTLIHVYVTCIRPVAEYGAQVWHYNIPEYLSAEVERIQLRAMRIIDSSLSYKDALVKYNLPTLLSRRNFLCSSFFNKNIQQQSDIVSELVKYAPSMEYDLRFPNKLVPYKCKTNRFKNSFIPSSIRIFNENC